MVALLRANNIDVNFTDSDIVRIGLEIAAGKMDDGRLDALIQERMG
jgi:hypothetical protein